MPTQTTRLNQAFIRVNGSDLAVEVMDALDEMIVEDDLCQPAMFLLRFHDPQLTLLDGQQFQLGHEVLLGVTNAQGQHTQLLKAEITALEPDLQQGNPVLVVRGYDRSHRLYRGRKTRTFLKQSDSSIAAQVASEAGLSCEAQSSPVTHDYVIQDCQTDMEFLRARAARIGYAVRMDQGKLLFKPFDATPQSAPEQDWGESLLSFRVRLSAVAQPNEVQVRAWDPKRKEPIVGQAKQPAQPSKIGEQKTGAQLAQQFAGSAVLQIADQPVRSQDEANKLAKAVLDELAADYLSAEGVCLGEPEIRAGKLVPIKGVGKRFGGDYYVTATRHEYAAGGYLTTFWVNGRRPSGLLATLDGQRPAHTVEGVVTGIVTNLNDPEKLGRVKLKFPWLAENEESDWARLATPGAGKGRGFHSSPEVDDEVLVAFEHGDIHRPYVIGGLWNGKDTPPASVVENGQVQVRALTTRTGHCIEIRDDDAKGQGTISLKTKGGNLLTISDTDKGIQLKSGAHTIQLDDQGRLVTIESGGDIQLKAMGGKLTIGKQGIEINSDSNLKLQANAMLDVKSNTLVNIQGSLVKIN